MAESAVYVRAAVTFIAVLLILGTCRVMYEQRIRGFGDRGQLARFIGIILVCADNGTVFFDYRHATVTWHTYLNLLVFLVWAYGLWAIRRQQRANPPED